MSDDLARTLEALIRAGLVESARVEIVLKPKLEPSEPQPPAELTCRFLVGPISTKE